MMRAQKEMAVRVEKAKSMSPEELAGKVTIGVLVDRDLPIYTQEYRRIREAAKAACGEIVQSSRCKVQSLRTSSHTTLNFEP